MAPGGMGPPVGLGLVLDMDLSDVASCLATVEVAVTTGGALASMAARAVGSRFAASAQAAPVATTGTPLERSSTPSFWVASVSEQVRASLCVRTPRVPKRARAATCFGVHQRCSPLADGLGEHPQTPASTIKCLQPLTCMCIACSPPGALNTHAHNRGRFWI